MAGKGSKAEGCAACLKWLLIIFNSLFCLFGIGLLAAGIYAYVALREYFNFLGNQNVNIPAILLIVFGCVTFLIAAIGCIGACKESPCLLFTFAIILGILLLAEVVVGAVAFAYRDKLDGLLSEGEKLLAEAKKENSTATGAKTSWDLLQKNLDCCGWNSQNDWLPGRTPDSCKDDDGKIYTTPCKEALKEFIRKNVFVVGGVGIGFGLIELMGIIFACCVGCAARKGEYA